MLHKSKQFLAGIVLRVEAAHKQRLSADDRIRLAVMTHGS
jgi:hypothetical protein